MGVNKLFVFVYFYNIRYLKTSKPSSVSLSGGDLQYHV